MAEHKIDMHPWDELSIAEELAGILNYKELKPDQ